MMFAKTRHNCAFEAQTETQRAATDYAGQQRWQEQPLSQAQQASLEPEMCHERACEGADREYVCDITLLRLEKGDGGEMDYECGRDVSDDSDAYSLAGDDDNNYNYRNNKNNNAKDFDELSLSSSSSSDCFGGLSQLYLNDIEVDRCDEEETITELVRASGEGELLEGSKNNRLRVAFGIILRLVLPLANGVARGFKGIRDVRFMRALKSIASSRQALTNVIAFAANTISMSLSSVQVSHRIEPILKLMKIRRSRDGLECLPDTVSAPTTPISTTTPTSYSPFLREPKGSLPRYAPGKRKTSEQPAPKCCTLNILAEPPPGMPVRADVVFIHGLHGSLVNTWKQGLWENERRPVEFERPPKPPLRPPKRPRHSRSTAIRPPHKQKRARFMPAEQLEPISHCCDRDDQDTCEGDDKDFSYICGAPEDIQMCDGLEYSFPTFRLRMNNNSRLLQAELESMLNGETEADTNCENARPNGTHTKRGQKKASPKPSPDDPNYSRCWPGDWLPIDCPGVRVIAVNYTTDRYLWRPLWKPKEPRTNLVQRAREMAELLIAQRVGYGHPIIWVGHSKGGLFVKQLIVEAWESGRPAAEPFWRSARGVFFYSVPHRGSHLASIKAPLLTRSVELLDIEKNSKYLIDLHRRFAGLYQLGHLKIEVFSFVETALTLMSVLYLRVVGVDSADPGIGDVCGIHLDHREICKPRSRECILYTELVKMINKVC